MADVNVNEVLTEAENAAVNEVAVDTPPVEGLSQDTSPADPVSVVDAALPKDDPVSPQGEGAAPPASGLSDGDIRRQIGEVLDGSVQQILTAFKGLQESFDAKLKYDAKKDAIIDRQFQELTQFKNGLVTKVTMQIVSDLIAEIDSAEKLVRFYEGAECNEANFKKLIKVLKDIPASLCDVLEKYGVTSYRSSVGALFNPKRQRALKTTETGDASKDKTINELLRLGFEQEIESADGDSAKTKIVRSEMVDVYVYNETLSSGSPEDQPAAEKKIEPASEQTGTEETK